MALIFSVKSFLTAVNTATELIFVPWQYTKMVLIGLQFLHHMQVVYAGQSMSMPIPERGSIPDSSILDTTSQQNKLYHLKTAFACFLVGTEASLDQN